MGWMRDENGLEKNNANYIPLTPLSHINRAAEVFPDREAVIYGNHRKTWLETVSYTHLTLPTILLV